MLIREEDFFRFDDAESPTPSSSGGTGSNASGSGIQSPPPFFPNDMNSYVSSFSCENGMGLTVGLSFSGI